MSSGRRPSFFRRLASLAEVVVLPAPLRPQMRMRAGGLRSSGAWSPPNKRGELVVEDLDDLFAGFDRLEHVLAHGLFLHLGDEVLGDAEFDIGLQQGDADFAQGVGDVFFRDAAHAAEVAEGFVEAVGE